MIYFDNAATTGYKPQAVINSVNFATKNLNANPGRSGHSLSQKAALTVYSARVALAEFFDCNGPENVVFTANCTQSINFVIKGVLNRETDHIIVSDLEHNAVMRPLITNNFDYSVAETSLTNDDLTVENFKKLIKPNTKMIFCTAASNVLGKILPLKQIGELCRKNNLLFGVDAAQGGGILPISMKKMNIDFLCLAPHKALYTPMGLGVLIAQSKIEKTVIEGGTGTDSVNFLQPDLIPEKFESGTVNLPAIASITKGIEFIKSKNRLYDYEMNLVQKFYEGLLEIEGVTIYTNPVKNYYAPVFCFNCNWHNSEDTVSFLSKNGFALRGGLHCAPTAHKKIGTLDIGAVRFSPCAFNNLQQVYQLLGTIKKFKKLENKY